MKPAPTAIALFLLSAVVAVAPALGEAGPQRFSNLSLSDGLSQSSVYAVTQDARGFMWFGTEDGLNRFDGYNFTVYRSDPEVADSLASNTVYDLLRSRDGTLWIGTLAGGLNVYRPESDSFFAFRHEPTDETSLSHDAVFEIFEDSAGDLWVGTLGGGLNRLDRESGRFQRYSHDPENPRSLSGNRVVAIHEDSAGALWVGTDGAGLNRLDRETGLFERFTSKGTLDSLSNDRVFAILEDRQGNLWIGTHGGGLNRMDPATGRVEHFRHDPADPESLSSDLVLALWEGPEGGLWVGTGVIWTGAFGGGLNRLQPETGKFSHYRHDPSWPNSLATDDLLAFFADASGLLWVATNGGGLSRFHPGRTGFSHFRRRPRDPNSLSDNNIYGMHEDSTGIIWIGTWNGGLNRFDPRTSSFLHYRHDPNDPLSLPSDTVNAVFEDSQEDLWVGTESGLARMERPAGSFERVSLGPGPLGLSSGNEVQIIAEDRAGVLWLGTLSGGLLRFEPRSGDLVRYLHDPADPASLSNNNVYWVMEDSHGDLWVGTEGGLDLLDRETERFRHFRNDPAHADSLGSSDSMCVFESREGELWVGTYGGGLNLLDRSSGSFTRYTTKDGLPNDAVYGILEDDSGNLWMSTNNGLSRFAPHSGEFRNYDVHDGLQSNEFDAWAFLRSTDGRMFFGGINGFNYFDPSQLTVNTHRPPLSLTSFKLLNRETQQFGPVAEIREIEVPYRDRVLSFEFAALDYTAPEKNRYSYQLEGFDKDWVESGTVRDVTYTNLDPGRYVLRIRGSNSDGVWSKEALEVQLVVVPPFWMTRWFRALAALAVVLLTVAIYAQRTRSIRRRSLELAEINRQLNDEVARRQRTQEDLEVSNAQLESKHEELETFTYSVSHDLKSPLVTIASFTQLLEQDCHSGDLDRVASDLERIRTATTRMRQLLEELLQLSTIGRLRTPLETVSLSELAAEAVAQVAGSIEAAGVRVEIQPDMPSVVAERSRLLDLLQNLVDNAVKFIGTQPEPRVEIGGFTRGKDVVGYVRDNGIGIDPSHHERIFGLFRQLDGSDDGTGIGLAMAKRIVEVHGGRIWIESAGSGQGSTFYFALPREPLIARHEPARRSSS